MQTIPEGGILHDKVSSGILDKSKTSEFGFLSKATHSRIDSENKFLKNLNLPTINDNNQTKNDTITQNNNSIQEVAKDHEDPKHKTKCLSTKRSKIIFYSVMSIIAVATAIGVVCGVVYGIKQNKKEIFVPKAEMIVNVKRELNDVCRYNRTKNTTFLMDFNGTIESMKEKVTTDFIVNIYDIDNNSTDSTIYYAYVLIIDMTKKNMSNLTAEEESYGGVDIFQDSLSGVNDNDDFQIDEEDLAELNDEDKEQVISQSEALPPFPQQNRVFWLKNTFFKLQYTLSRLSVLSASAG